MQELFHKSVLKGRVSATVFGRAKASLLFIRRGRAQRGSATGKRSSQKCALIAAPDGAAEAAPFRKQVESAKAVRDTGFN
jgi:hypothetical protein